MRGFSLGCDRDRLGLGSRLLQNPGRPLFCSGMPGRGLEARGRNSGSEADRRARLRGFSGDVGREEPGLGDLFIACSAHKRSGAFVISHLRRQDRWQVCPHGSFNKGLCTCSDALSSLEVPAWGSSRPAMQIWHRAPEPPERTSGIETFSQPAGVTGLRVLISSSDGLKAGVLRPCLDMRPIVES